MKTQNDKVSEEVRELVYSDYNNKYEQLKAELQEIEKGCGKSKWEEVRKRICGIGHGVNLFYCPTCQAKIEYLKKGISACEELEKEAGVLKHWITCQDLIINDMEKELKQALSQRNQEILDKIEKFQKELLEIIDDCMSDWSYIEKKYNEKFDELKQQLNQPKEEQ